MTDPHSDATTVDPKLYRRTVGFAIAAFILLGLIVGFLIKIVIIDGDKGLGVLTACIAGAMLLIKEIVSAFALDRGFAGKQEMFGYVTAFCSLTAVVCGAPALVAAII